MPAISFIVLLLLAVSPLQAEPVTLEIKPGILANAEYRQGEKDKPVVFALHGFLQTHKFHTIHQLGESLSDEGYTVLAPSLSLNIPARKQSLPCEAIHTHTLQDAQREIQLWIDWLKAKGHKSIILVGHSTGSMMLLSYLAGQHDAAVDEMIGISIVEARMQITAEQQASLRKNLKQRIDKGDKTLVRQQFSFCQELQATPVSMHSYMVWNPEQILTTVKQIEKPLMFIMGSADKRLGENWTEQLKATGKKVHIIEGANHFIDGGHEFDLVDIILNHLS